MFRNLAGQAITLMSVNPVTGLPVTGDALNKLYYVSKDDGAVTSIASTAVCRLR